MYYAFAPYEQDFQAWWDSHEFPPAKPAAFVGLDDRVLTFTGKWPSFADLLAFKSWNRT